MEQNIKRPGYIPRNNGNATGSLNFLVLILRLDYLFIGIINRLRYLVFLAFIFPNKNVIHFALANNIKKRSDYLRI